MILPVPIGAPDAVRFSTLRSSAEISVGAANPHRGSSRAKGLRRQTCAYFRRGCHEIPIRWLADGSAGSNPLCPATQSVSASAIEGRKRRGPAFSTLACSSEGSLERRRQGREPEGVRHETKGRGKAGRRMVRCTTQPSTKAAQTPCAASPRPRAASGHRSVSNTAGINGTPLLTCHQMISGQVARTNSAAASRIHANKRQRLRIISPQSSTVCAPGCMVKAISRATKL
jgi:hypothetical protein